MNVLVTDGENRSSLALTRSLGMKGHVVFVTGKKQGNLSAGSKFCRKFFTTPDPLQDGVSYCRAIADIVKHEEIDVLFPMAEESIYCLNNAREQFGQRTTLACVPQDMMEKVSNKYGLFQLAEKLGVAIPATMYVANADDYFKKKSCKIDFPVVVKPSFSKIACEGKIISTGVMYATNQDELNCLYETKPALHYPSLIQEKIVGSGTGLFTLYDVNRHLALFSHRRIREKPPSGGVSVVSESVPLDEEMVESAGRLLTHVGWNGVAMIEFKRDQRDGKAKLMEINGRFWGSLQLAIACGVDFPALLLDHLQGKNPSVPIGNYLVGHKLKWFFGTLDHLLIRLKYNENKLNLPSGSPSRWQSLVDFLKVFDNDTSFDVFDRDDPGPFWLETRSYVRQAMRAKG